MAIVTRRYKVVGPSARALTTFVSLVGATVNTTFPTDAVDIDVDDAIDNIEESLDELMSEMGWTYDPAFLPGVHVQDEGIAAGSRQTLNFIGTGVAAVDNPGASRVDITVTAAVVTGSTPTQIDVGDAGVVGVATDAARSDHQHALPAPAAPANVTKAAASAGAATTVARSDHKHDVTTAAPTTVTGATNSEGTATSLARSDHQHRLALAVLDEGAAAGARPTINFIGAGVAAVDNGGADRVDVTVTAAVVTGSTPTQIDVGDAGAVGVATDAARSDHEHALPVPAAPANVTKAAASAGGATTVARADHKHDVTTAAPATVTGATNSEGTATSLARSDHQHRLEVAVLDEGAAAGSRPALNFIGAGVAAVDNPGSERVDVTVTAAVVTASTPTQIDVGDAGVVGVATDAARSDHQHALPVPAAPANVTKAAASAGAATTVARADHKHDVTTAAPITVTGATNSEGTSTSLARADHQHALTVAVLDEAAAAGSRPTLNFTGGGVSAVDDAGNNRVNVTVGAGTSLMTWGNDNIGAAIDTRFLNPGRTASIATTGDLSQIPIDGAGTLRRLYVRHNAGPGGAGTTVVYTVFVNGAGTAITVTLPTDSVNQVADLTHSVAVAAGDRVSVQVSKAAGITNGNVQAQASLALDRS